MSKPIVEVTITATMEPDPDNTIHKETPRIAITIDRPQRPMTVSEVNDLASICEAARQCGTAMSSFTWPRSE